MNAPTPLQVVRSAGFYPITLLYVAAVGIALCATKGGLTVTAGFIIFGLLTAIAVLFAAWKELRTVHKLVNSQRTELLHRIDVLTELLEKAGTTVPPEGNKEQSARRELADRGDHGAKGEQ